MAMMQNTAADVIVPRFESLSDDQIIEKNPGDLVTVADREAEVIITKHLRAAFPSAVIVGEEACSENPNLVAAVGHSEHLFVVDPVDGTKNFVNGRNDFGVMVAEMRGSEPTRCWIWQPIHNQAWFSEKGAGNTCNGALITPTPVTRDIPHGASGNPSDAGSYPEAIVHPAAWACAVDYPMLAKGELDFLIYRYLNPWDHVPGLVIINELGGQARLANGEPYTGIRVNAPGFIATKDDHTYDQLAPLMHRLVADQPAALGPNSPGAH